MPPASAREAAEWSFVTAQGAPLSIAVAPRCTVNAAEPAVDAAMAGRGIVRALSYQLAAAFGSGARWYRC